MQRGLYRHHKGGLYVVIGVVVDATNATAGREMVIYTSCTTGKMHARAREEFEENVDGPLIASPFSDTPYRERVPRFVLEIAA